MNHDQFLANNNHSSPCILQNHSALWQLNPSLWSELLKSWYWWVLVSRETKVTKGWMHCLPGLGPGKGEVEPDTEHWVFFLFGFMKGTQVGQMLHWQHGSLQRMEGGPAIGLCKYTERKGDKCISADHMCACDWGLRRSPYTLVDILWAATRLKAVSVQLCIQLLSKSGDGTATLMVAVVSDLFVWCSMLCDCGDGGSGRKVHVTAFRTQKLSLRGSHRNSYCIWEEEFYK